MPTTYARGVAVAGDPPVREWPVSGPAAADLAQGSDLAPPPTGEDHVDEEADRPGDPDEEDDLGTSRDGAGPDVLGLLLCRLGGHVDAGAVEGNRPCQARRRTGRTSRGSRALHGAWQLGAELERHSLL